MSGAVFFHRTREKPAPIMDIDRRDSGGRAGERTDAAVGWAVRVGTGRGAGAVVGERPVRLAAGALRPARLARTRAGTAPCRAALRRRTGPPAHRAGQP